MSSTADFIIEGTVLERYDGNEKVVEIPAGITAIGDGAFAGNPWCTKVIVPEGVTTIGSCAFFDCSCLHTVILPKTLTTIEAEAFELCCALETITIPESVTTIAKDAFADCPAEQFLSEAQISLINTADKPATEIMIYSLPENAEELTEIIVPEGVEFLADYQFERLKNLRTISLPSTLRTVKATMFPCNNRWSHNVLERIDISPDNPYYKSVDGILYSKDMTVLICVPCNHPASDLIVPEAVQTIAKRAFSGNTNIFSVALPKTLKVIEESAFQDCASLKKASPIFADSIEQTAFSNCGIENIELHVPVIGKYAFSDCAKLINIALYETQAIEEGSFSCCGITEVTLPESVTNIGMRAFADCKLTSITIPKSVTSVGNGAFLGVKSIHVYDSLQTAVGVINMWTDRIRTTIPYHEVFVYSATTNELKYCIPMEWDGTNKHLDVLCYGWNNSTQFNFQQHDAFFSTLKGTELKIKTAIRRLEDPIGMSAAAKEMYMAYVIKNAKAVMKKLIDQKDFYQFCKFADYGTITKKNISELLDYAEEKQAIEIADFLKSYPL